MSLFSKKTYQLLIYLIILIPNVFVVVFGIESFPYTCAPMFGHYIDNNTSLYLLKFEGENELAKVDLTDYYGKDADLFIRHFFSKVYGSTEDISPFTNKLSESPKQFQTRMNEFFNHYSKFLKNKYNLSFHKIYLSTKKVNQNRNTLTDYEVIGFFDSVKANYYPLYKKLR